MFFKILKKDLKKNRLLNIILLIFITVSCLLMTVSTINIFINISDTTNRAINKSDLTMSLTVQKPFSEIMISRVDDFMQSEASIDGFSKDTMIPAYKEILTVNGKEIKNNSYLKDHDVKIIKNNTEYNLLYTVDDKPFSVTSGNIAVSVDFSRAVGAKKGDTIEITSQLGNCYRFSISEVFKNVLGTNHSFLVVSENDYEVLFRDNPAYNIRYEIASSETSVTEKKLLSILSDHEKYKFTYTIEENDSLSDGDVLLALSVFVVLTCVFLVFIILMSIRFTILSAVKNETKEIGMMRAAGVDSFGFRTIFAAKYIAFIFIGGITGVLTGIPLARIFCSKFSANMISPGIAVKYGIGVVSVLVLMAVMLISTILSMKSIDKISVVDAIHGNTRGERFSKVTPFYLHKCSKISTGLFLAVSDVFVRFRRWLIILVVYSFGIMIIMLGCNLENTINSTDYLKTIMYNDVDFSVNFDSTGIENVLKKCGNIKKLQNTLNQKFSDSDIPAKITFDYIQYADLIVNDNTEVSGTMIFGEYNTENFIINKGGHAPKLRNEVALGSYTADKYSIYPGDTVKITYRKYIDQDKTTVNTVTEEFLVTGLIDIMEAGKAAVLCGNEFDSAQIQGIIPVSFRIQGSEKEKEEYVNMMNDIYGEGSFYNSKETLQNNIGYITDILNSIKYTISVIVISIIILVTILHYSVTIAEDKTTVAFLKSTGFSSSSIKGIQIKRSLILLFISLAAGNILTFTLGNIMLDRIFRVYGLKGLTLDINPTDTFVIVPLILTAVILITMFILTGRTDGINVSEINSEQ